jgi:signal transduction histidine kinase
MRTEMAQDLKVCQQHLTQYAEFNRCAEANQAGSVYNTIKHHYHFCNKPSNSTSDKLCSQIKQLEIAWQAKPDETTKGYLFSTVVIEGESWLATKYESSQDVLLLNQKWVTDFVVQLWKIRDQNIAKSVPTVLISIMLLAMYMVFILMRPLKLFENKMAKLNSQSLFYDEPITSPYKEFNQLIHVYSDLRKRLAESFNKARRFSSDVSHELRTPLSILRGNAERMISELPVGSAAQLQASLMSDEIERLILITEKLLLLSRADANSLQLEMDQLNVSQVMQELVEDAQSFHPDLQIRHNIQDDVVWTCDAQLIHQLIQNLYTNAVKYNTPKGWIALDLTRTDGQLKLSIENPSQDVAQDLAEHGFERFYRGDASRTRGVDGFGLGLSICQEIAHVHGGRLTLLVTPEQTVRVTLTAPLA